jgi:cytochrome c oxidase cbb3-type subunit III
MRLILVAGFVVSAVLPPSLFAQAGGGRLSAFAAKKAETLIQQQLPCLGCHVLKGTGGRIGPDLTTVRERRSPEYIAEMVSDPQKVVPGSVMPRVPMAPGVRELVVGYLLSLPATSPAGSGSPAAAPAPAIGTPAADPASARTGAALYARYCAPCHGGKGAGDGPNATNLPVPPAAHSSRAAMSQRSDDALYDTIAGGGLIMNRSPRMPPFGETLSPAEMRALVAYIRELCGCRGPAWSNDPPSGPAPK